MAATLSSTNATARDMLIEGVYNWLSLGNMHQAFPDAYKITGDPLQFVARCVVLLLALSRADVGFGRPVIGGVFSAVALDKLA